MLVRLIFVLLRSSFISYAGGRTANEATPSNPQGFGTVLQQYTLLGEM